MASEDGCWSQGFFFPLRWFWRVHRRDHPVPWLPARCLRHHRGTQPVEERHRHYYSPPRFRQHRQPWRLQVQAEKPVVQHIYKGTADCLKNIAAEEALPPASAKSSLLTRSAASAVPWCWCSMTVQRRTCALTVRPAQLLLSSCKSLSLRPEPSDTSQ